MSAAIYQQSDLLLHDVTGYFNNLVIASFCFDINEYGDIPLPDLRRFIMFGLELEVEGVEVVERDAEAASPDHFPCVQLLINIGHKVLHVPLLLLIPEHVMVYLHNGEECSYLPEQLLVHLPLILIRVLLVGGDQPKVELVRPSHVLLLVQDLNRETHVHEDRVQPEHSDLPAEILIWDDVEGDLLEKLHIHETKHPLMTLSPLTHWVSGR
jgi:hypothetical protein